MNILARAQELETTSNGTIAAGFLYAKVKNIAEETATVNGVSLSAGEAKIYPFIGKGYEAVPYNPNGSRLQILSVV